MTDHEGVAEGFAHEHVHILPALVPLVGQHHLQQPRAALHCGRQYPFADALSAAVAALHGARD